MLVYKLCQESCTDKIEVIPSIKLGDGADGEVFEIKEDPNKVIKFCTLFDYNMDLKKSYKNISQIINYLISNSPQTYAKVFSHKYMGEYSRDTVWGKQKYILYYYTMEKLMKLSEDEKKVFHSLISHEDQGKQKNWSSIKLKEMLTGLQTGLDFDRKKVIFFMENFVKIPIIHTDIHPRNIMKDASGNFKLIDFDRAKFTRR
jgi:serine/threonine protein kinase